MFFDRAVVNSIAQTLSKKRGRSRMAISYKKLWHILLDRDMKKKDLERLAGINEYTTKKLTRNENVSAEVLGKISIALGCPIDDFVEFTPDED